MRTPRTLIIKQNTTSRSYKFRSKTIKQTVFGYYLFDLMELTGVRIYPSPEEGD